MSESSTSSRKTVISMSEDNQRLMSETLPDLGLILDPDGLSVSDSTGGYEVDFAGGWAIAHRFGYFDLSKYPMYDETVFIQSVLNQEFSAFKGLSRQILVVDLISTTPLRLSDLTKFSAFSPFQPQLPGTPLSTKNLEEIVSGSMRVLTKNSNLAVDSVYQEIWRSGWGTGTATAGEKLYYCRAYYMDPTQYDVATGASLIAPANAYVLPITFDNESVNEYMMRLKRSYELQQE